MRPSPAACSSGPQGVVVNLYGGASESGFDEIIADCNQQANGRYTIVGNLLPSDADGQRDQLVQRVRQLLDADPGPSQSRLPLSAL